MRTRARRALSIVLLATALVFYRTDGSAQTPFYQGKTITVVSGVAAGGTGDIRIRALLPFWRKYIPGNPALIVENIPGAGEGVRRRIISTATSSRTA
jgi:tripartite-type tricarboxylate transporter receptor subunit TctC